MAIFGRNGMTNSARFGHFGLHTAGRSDHRPLDAMTEFLQVPLVAESISLTTIATPFGRYKFLHLPFGLSSSSEAY
jgi:hypothetical protein